MTTPIITWLSFDL